MFAQVRQPMSCPKAASAGDSPRALSRRQLLLWCGACRGLSYRWLAGWGHAPDGVRKVVGDDEGATRVHAHPDRPATSLSVRPSEAGDEVDWRTGGAAATERHKNHLVPDWLAAIPTAMLTEIGRAHV